MTAPACFILSITLRSPFMTGGDTLPAFGVDARLPHDGDRDGKPVIPGTLIRGVLRDALNALCDRGKGSLPGLAAANHQFLSRLFGRASGANKMNDMRKDGMTTAWAASRIAAASAFPISWPTTRARPATP